MKYEQLPLFYVQPDPRVAVYDPHWDKPTFNVGEQLISEDSPCNNVGEQVSLDTKKVAHQQDKPVTHRSNATGLKEVVVNFGITVTPRCLVES